MLRAALGCGCVVVHCDKAVSVCCAVLRSCCTLTLERTKRALRRSHRSFRSTPSLSDLKLTVQRLQEALQHVPGLQQNNRQLASDLQREKQDHELTRAEVAATEERCAQRVEALSRAHAEALAQQELDFAEERHRYESTQNIRAHHPEDSTVRNYIQCRVQRYVLLVATLAVLSSVFDIIYHDSSASQSHITPGTGIYVSYVPCPQFRLSVSAVAIHCDILHEAPNFPQLCESSILTC